MKFTLATFVTLVAAGAAAPSPQAEGPSISQEGKNKLDQYSHQCGDIKNINCCITVKDTEKKNQLLGIPGWLGATLNSQSDDNDDICRSATNGDTGVFDYLPALLGLSASEQDSHLCDYKGVNYVCCAPGSSCTILGSNDNGDGEKSSRTY